MDSPSMSSSPFPRLPPPPNPQLQELLAAAATHPPVYWSAGVWSNVTAYGASCTVSRFRPSVEPGDFSLLSVALINNDASHGQQMMQAGWIRAPNGLAGSPADYNADLCHLFVYYNTVGPDINPGDFVGGFNDYVKGWVPVPGAFRPGIDVLPGSHIGGPHKSVDLKFQLAGDRWNLRMDEKVIGYYPTSLFTTDNRDPARPSLPDISATLANHATQVAFYGQVYDSGGGITSTNMGSGKLPDDGAQRSAFVGKMQYQPKPSAVNPALVDANDSWTRIVDSRERYDCLVAWKSGSTWRSYMYIGGPGCEQGGWSSWDTVGGPFEEFPGGLATTSPPITAISRKAGVIDLFVVRNDGKVLTSWWEDGDWSGYNRNEWRLLDMGGGQTFLPSPKIVAVAQSADNLDIFALSTDYKIYWAKWSEGHDWTGWVNITTKQPISPSPPPVLAAISRYPGRIDLFVLTAHVLFAIHWDEGAGWAGLAQPWDPVDQSPSPVANVANILALSASPTNMELIMAAQPFFLGPQVVCKSWNDGAWSAFQTAGRPFNQWTFGVTPVAGVATAGGIDLFAMVAEGLVFTTHRDLAGVWAGVPDKWISIGGVRNHFRSGNEIVAVSRKASCIDVFVAGMDGEIYVNSKDASAGGTGRWSGWKSIGGPGQAMFGDYSMAMCSRNNQTMAVFGRNKAGTIRAAEWLDPICGPRPFYCVSHNPNLVLADGSVDDVAASLNEGANALGPDINKDSDGSLIIYHGFPPDIRKGPKLEWYLQHLHGIALGNPQLALVVFDCKPAVHEPATGLAILAAIRQHLTHDIPLNIILSVSSRDSVKKLFGEDIGRLELGPREGIMVDEDKDTAATAQLFARLNAGSHASYGNGISVELVQPPFFSPRLRPSIEQGVAMAAGQDAFQHVFTWTFNDVEYMREFIRIGVNGILSDFESLPLIGGRTGLSKLADLVQNDPEMRRQVRMATREDALLPGPPAAYELTVVTGATGAAGTDANLTFTLRGELGTCKKTIDSSLQGGPFGWFTDGRMEAGGTDYVVIFSRDIGQLREITVYNDMTRSVLGNSKWRCESVRVRSNLYRVDRTAVFGVDVANVPITRPL